MEGALVRGLLDAADSEAANSGSGLAGQGGRKMTTYLTAKLVGEGFARPDGEKTLPIDVHYAKLSEWLVDRKQVPADWNRKLQAIQAKLAESVRELPLGFLGQFEGGNDTPMDYFLAQQVMAKLGETAEKSLLGSLKGAAGEWDKVVRAYEYNLIYVAEAAQTLCRNTDYEVPFFKKQAAKFQQQLADLERRKVDAHKSAVAAATDFQQECQSLGINRRDIRGGLLGLTAELPALVGAAVEALQAEGVSEGLEYYAAAVAASQQQQRRRQGVTAPAAAGAPADLLPVLREVREGRTAPPAAAAEAEAARKADAASSSGLDVDWDLRAALLAAGGGDKRGDSGAPAAGISWDLDASDLAAAASDGGEAAGNAAAGAAANEVPADDATAAVDISWDIDISGGGEESEQQVATQQQQVASAAAVPAAAAAVAEEPAPIKRLIEDAAYRARLLDDLHELQAFLSQRTRELSGRSSELLMAAAPQAGGHISADVVATMLAAVDAALAQFGGDKLKRLIALRTSGRYLDRLAAALQQKAAQEAKFLRAAADAELKRGEVQRQLMTDSAKLAVLVQRTRRAKEEVERVLSAKLGRRINVMGELNQLA